MSVHEASEGDAFPRLALRRPRIEERDYRTQLSCISCDHRQVVLQRGSGEQAVNHRQRLSLCERLPREPAPTIGDFLPDGQDAIGKPKV